MVPIHITLHIEVSRMNTRDYKQFAINEYYHVFNRGNGKMNIFLDDEDYSLFLHRLAEAVHPDRRGSVSVNGAHSQGRNQRRPLPVGAFSIAAYCLMPNHFHLLIRQNSELPVSTLISKVCGSYSKIFNKRYKRVGSLFQDQFKAVHIEDDTQLKHVSAYVHQNPKVARLVHDLKKWKYSSYPEYLGENNGGVCNTTMILEQFKNTREYLRFVEDAFEDIRARKNAAHGLMLDE